MSDTGTTESAEEETQALASDGLREQIVADLRDDLGEQLLDVHLVPQSDLWVRVAPEAWTITAEALKAQGFEYFCFLSALDWLPSPYGKGEEDPDAADDDDEADEMRPGYTGGDTRFQLFARVVDTDRHVGITIKCDVPESMSMPTWIPFYAGANWHERETHEMFGIGFDGHPDLRNIYLPGEFEGFPLRKDFPLLARMIKPWPGIVDVEPMPERAEERQEAAQEQPSAESTSDEPARSADTAAGDEVAAATGTDADGLSDTDESADATVVDNPPTDHDTEPGTDPDVEPAAAAVDAADDAPDAVEPHGEPVEGGVADTIITDDATDEGAASDDEGSAR